MIYLTGQMSLRPDSLGLMSSFLMRSTPGLAWLMARPMARTVCAPSLFMEISTKEETTKQESCSHQPIQVSEMLLLFIVHLTLYRFAHCQECAVYLYHQKLNFSLSAT